MKPCRTAIVGLLVISCCALAQADVSHLYNVGDMAANLPEGTPYWWLNDKSPFKRAILGCNGGNGCAAQSNQVAFAAQPSGFVSQQQQLGGGYELNPFLNAGSKHGSINMYLPPVREPETFPCEGQAVCVTRQGCASGFILSTNVPQSGLNRPCQVNSEVCCRVQVPVPVTTPAPVPSIPCNQPNFFCVPPQFCSNGVIQGQNNRLQSNPRCFGNDVCCRYQPVVPQPTHTTPRYVPPPTTPRYVPVPTTQRPVTTTQYRGPDYIPPRTGDASNPQPDIIRGDEDKPLLITQQACPAAMNCTEIQFCDATGVISKSPVQLTRQQELFRVPMTDCRDVRRNIVGKCCRDPDYVDPWPATSLGQYNREIIGALFDDGSYKPPQGGFQQTGQKSQTSQVTVNRNVQNTQSRFPDLVGSASGSCGVRNVNSVPRGAGEFDTGFGEFTWQAMVLMQSNKSLLCGGAIIDENTIATSAHCVQGVNPRDLKVKCGEWKLGVDDEPKPFQITGVRAVSFHPAYNPANLNNDLALLHCDERIRYDQHVGPICLEDQFGSASSENCETTGWGKDVLRIHLKGAIMNRVPVQELSQQECSGALSGYGYNPQSSTCCRPKGGDACLADVGSALACRMPSGQYLLRGVYSTETECGSPSQIVSFAKIDTQWVRQALRNPGGNGNGNGIGHGSAQASQTITQTVVTNHHRHEVLAQPNAPHVYSVPSQAPLYLPPL